MNNRTKQKSLVLLAAVLAAASLSAGCTRGSYLRQVRDNFEFNSVREMRVAQALNPEAGQNRKVVAGLDSQVANNIHETYVKSFTKADASQQGANALFLGLKGVSND